MGADWHERSTVIVGDAVERVMDRRITRNRDLTLYRPIQDDWHRVDRMMLDRLDGTLIMVEYKARSPRSYYPDVGIEERTYHGYEALSAINGLPMFVYFVDRHEKIAWLGRLSDVSRPRMIFHKGKWVEYPLLQKGFIYFPLQAMLRIDITPEIITEWAAILFHSGQHAAGLFCRLFELDRVFSPTAQNLLRGAVDALP